MNRHPTDDPKGPSFLIVTFLHPGTTSRDYGPDGQEMADLEGWVKGQLPEASCKFWSPDEISQKIFLKCIVMIDHQQEIYLPGNF